MKLKELIDSTDISPALVRAVVSQIGSWEYIRTVRVTEEAI